VFDEKNIKIFSSRDKIRSQLIDYTKNYLELENTDLSQESYLSYYIDVLSVLSSNLIFYNTSVWREFFLTKAIQKESVVNLAATLGYSADLARPAFCNVLVKIPCDFNSTQVSFILHGRKVSNDSTDKPYKLYADNELVFIPLNSIQVTVNTTNGNISAEVVEYIYKPTSDQSNIPYTISTEGTKNYLSFVIRAVQLESLSGEDLEFNIGDVRSYEFIQREIEFEGDVAQIDVITNSMSLINGVYTIVANTNDNASIEWTRYDSLYLIPSGEYGYTIRKTDKGIKILFGNDIIGKQPESNTKCQLFIHTTKGSLGNVVPGSVSKADSIVVQDTSNGNSIYRTLNVGVTNPEPGYGGKDSPTTDDIRAAAINQVSTNNRLVTKYDFDLAEYIIADLPVKNATHVLKRSDLKRNEICMFTDLIYNDTINNQTYVVPTRNAKWLHDTSGGVDLIIRNNEEIVIDSKSYVSLFNIQLDISDLSCLYFYTVDSVKKAITVSRSQSAETQILPQYCQFSVSQGSTAALDMLYFDLYYVDISASPPNMVAEVELPWNGQVISMAWSYAEKKFYLRGDDYILLSTIEEGVQKYKFTIYDISTEVDPVVLNICYTSAVVKENLDEYMYSQVELYDSTAGTYYVYDVPVIDKDYYDSISTSDKKSEFDYYILSKLALFDVTKYKMMTDFVNLKFSNTTGKITNMDLNPVTKSSVVDINPCAIPTGCTVGDRYAVSDDDNPWAGTPWNLEGGFIAEYSAVAAYGWGIEFLGVNDIFYVDSLATNMIYNGDAIVEMVQDIPIDVEIEVWMDKSYSGSDFGLITTVKDTLINSLYSKFGYDKNLYISEIIRVVKSVAGVSNCKVLKPEHDIEFKYDIYEDLTQQQLLEYSPDLIYIDSDSITIKVRT